MIANYHTHTTRCNHAHGTDREYIEGAIHAGLKILGFADHSPYYFDTDHYSFYRMKPWEVEEYTSTLLALKEEYKNDIEILIGYEMEYYPKFFERALEMITPYPCDYLILGQHFIEEEYRGIKAVIEETADEEKLRKYTDNVVLAIKSGTFTYVAHPDMMNFTGDKELYAETVREICTASKKYNVPLEINFLGIRGGRNYPNENFWKIAGEVQCPVVFGLDAHEAKDAADEASLVIAKRIADKYNLNYIEMPILKGLD